jgi:hypothetical protein
MRPGLCVCLSVLESRSVGSTTASAAATSFVGVGIRPIRARRIRPDDAGQVGAGQVGHLGGCQSRYRHMPTAVRHGE